MSDLKALVPMAHVASVPRSIAFYAKLGFTTDNTFTPPGRQEPVWAWLKAGGANLMVTLADGPIDDSQQGILFYMYTPDVKAYRETLVAAGVEAGPIQHRFYAERGEFRFTDPDGDVLLAMNT